MSRRVSRGVARGDGATSIRETTRGVLDSVERVDRRGGVV